MDHMSDWMLPGAALVLLVIGGIVLVALDDIVMALSRLRRKGGDSAAAGTGDESLGRGRRARAKKIAS
jgi:hypothetical protein